MVQKKFQRACGVSPISYVPYNIRDMENRQDEEKKERGLNGLRVAAIGSSVEVIKALL